jgi:hypothetical protein
MSNCDACKEIKKTEPVPYIVHESAQARNERTVKRLVVALIVAIALIFASNAIWLYAWMQYDYSSDMTTSEINVDGKDGIANYIGNDGDINNGSGYGSESD